MQSLVPYVSIIVPTFNELPEVLEASLGSLRTQTFPDFECIVIDESTDRAIATYCQAICRRDHRFRYHHPPSRIGLAASLNLGIQMAHAELIARFDADDICVNERLSMQIEFLKANPDVDVLGGSLEIIDNDGRPVASRKYPTRHQAIARLLQFTTPMAHPTVMFKKRLLEQFGGYDSGFRYCEDLDLWLRLLRRGARFANLSDVLVKYRQADTRRSPKHWRFNLKARIRNFNMQFLSLRIGGILAISIWSSLPDFIQVRVFHGLLLRRAEP
jgi:glycosyltransferase involved in cell wall biosynthesis